MNNFNQSTLSSDLFRFFLQDLEQFYKKKICSATFNNILNIFLKKCSECFPRICSATFNNILNTFLKKCSECFPRICSATFNNILNIFSKITRAKEICSATFYNIMNIFYQKDLINAFSRSVPLFLDLEYYFRSVFFFLQNLEYFYQKRLPSLVIFLNNAQCGQYCNR